MTKHEMAFRIISGVEPYTNELYKQFIGTEPPDRDESTSVFDHLDMCLKLLKQDACKFLADAILKHTHY